MSGTGVQTAKNTIVSLFSVHGITRSLVVIMQAS